MRTVVAAVETLGRWTRKGISAVFGVLFTVLKAPFVLLVKAVFAVRDFAAASFRRVVGDERFFTGRVVRAVKGITHALKHDRRSLPRVIRYYAGRSVARYGGLARYMLLLAAPLCAAALLVFTFSHFSARSPAFRLTAGDEIIGFVRSESVFYAARSAAAQILAPGAGKDDAAAAFPEVSFAPALVKPNEFMSESALRDRLLELSNASLTGACGVYINGDFLCAVKSEDRARGVFDDYLASLTAGTEGLSAFAEEITFRQGLYPDSPDFIKSPEELAGMIVPAENTRYYTVAAGDGDVSAVAAKNGLSAAELRALNPALAEMKEGEDLKEGLRLAVSRGEQMLTVKTVTTEVVKENTPFETVEVKSDSLYIGTSRVVVKGQKGFDQITNLVTYLGGVRVRSEEVSRISVKEPVAQTLQVGTRALDSSYVIATSYGGILLWPAVGTDHINSDYGYRWGKLHAALDIGSTVGTSLGKTVVAAAGGTVVISGVHSSYGYYVKIDHGNGLQTLYAHCMAGSLMVSVGQKVAAGQPIARVGQTGYATGPHLHFEVIVNGVRVDPKPYLGLV